MRKLILIALALVTIQATAQEMKKELKKEVQKERTHNFQEFTPEEAATLQTKKMTLHLDLTQEQQDKVYKINLENAEVRKSKMEERKAMNEKDADTKPSKEEHLKRTNEKLDHQIAMKRQMKAILTAPQYEKYSQGQGRKHAKGKGVKKHEKKQ